MQGDYFQHCSNQQWLFSAFHYCLFVLIFQLLTRNKISSSKPPPGPGLLPTIGDQHRLGQFPYKSLQKKSQKYGDIIYLKLGQVPLIVFSSRQLVEKVAKVHDLDFCNRAQRVSIKKFTYNFLDVAFSPCNTDTWKQLRRLYIQELLSSKRMEMSRSIQEEMVARTVNRIEEIASANPGQCINLSDLITVHVKDIVCGTYLGKSWNPDPGETKRIVSAFEELNDLCGNSCVGDYLRPWARWVDVLTGYNKRMEKVSMFLTSILRRSSVIALPSTLAMKQNFKKIKRTLWIRCYDSKRMVPLHGNMSRQISPYFFCLSKNNEERWISYECELNLI